MTEIERLKRFTHNLLYDKYRFSILIISIVFSILFTIYSFLQFNLMDMSAWDMGVYTQALYSGIHGHLFYTALLPGSYLSEHFESNSGICNRAIGVCSLHAFP